MKKITILAGLTGLLIVLVAVGSYFLESPEERFESTREMMDTYVTIIVYHQDEGKAKKAIEAAFDRMKEIEGIASRFNTSSELYRLNEEGMVENPSPELREMIGISVRYWNITGGAFDITILPLLELWDPSSGVGPYHLFDMNRSYSGDLDAGNVSQDIKNVFSNNNHSLNETPNVIVKNASQEWTIKSGRVEYTVINASGGLMVDTRFFWNVDHAKQEEYINQTKQFVGSDKIGVSNDSISLEPGMSLTLDGMTKGYAVDAAITVLKEKGIKRALVDAGGDIATLGTKPGGKKWVTGLRDPGDKSTSVTEFELSDQAIATSGNYERYFDENASVGHIMDPGTGRSIFRCSSATIIADNCTVADILATGVFVLGAEDGIRLVETLPGIEALLLGYEDPKEIFRSSGLGDYEIED